MGDLTVFATYSSREELEGAISMARGAGFRTADVSVLVPGGVSGGEPDNLQPGERKSVRLGTDVVIAGGGVGSLVSAGTLMVPGIGPMLAAGPILTALSKAQAERVVADITGWLIGLGVPARRAKSYQGLLQDGCILAGLHADNAAWAKRAKQLFEGTGAQNISEADAAKGAFAQTDKPKLRKAS